MNINKRYKKTLKFGDSISNSRATTLIATAFASALSMASASADDTEVFFGQPASSSDTNPNVLFILDTSGSMAATDGTGLSRLQRMKNAVHEILDNTSSVNVGLMRFNGNDGGGPILYPITALDQETCEVGDVCSRVTSETRIGSHEDDAEEVNSSGDVNTANSSLNLGSYLTEPQTVGLHFSDLSIPQGARIVSARLEMTANLPQTTPANLTIAGELTPNSLPFTDGNANLSGRALTSNNTQWNITENWNLDEAYGNDDIAGILQEIVDQQDWCGGYSASLLLTGTGARSVHSFDYNDTQAPILKYTYDTTDIPVGGGCTEKTILASLQEMSDDAEEVTSDGMTYTVHPPLDMPYHADHYPVMTGYRFDELNIPQGATIVDANLIFKIYRQNTKNLQLSVRIYGENTGDAETYPLALGYKMSSRDKTLSVDWNDVPNPPKHDPLITPNIATIAQSIVNRGDWAAGNAMAFVIEHKSGSKKSSRYLESYESDKEGSAKLRITYQAVKSPSVSIVTTARDKIKEQLDLMNISGGTPILSTYYEGVQYFRGEAVDYAKKRGYSGISYDYRLSSPLSYTGGTLDRDEKCTDENLSDYHCIDEKIEGNPIYTSPISTSCQTNHIVILSDGAPAGEITAMNRVRDLTGNSSCNTVSCAYDMAEWLNDTDHSSSINGIQPIKTHTIGFYESSAYLEEIANQGDGDYYTANSSAQLVDAFKSILGDVMSVDTSFVAPSVTVNQFNRLSNRNDVYYALFKPSSSPIWEGNLKRYEIGTNDAGEVIIKDQNGNPAVDPATGFFSDTSRSYWSDATDGSSVSDGGAAAELGFSYADGRKVYTYVGEYADIPSTGVDLTETDQRLRETNASITAADLGIDNMPVSAYEKLLHRTKLLKWARGLDMRDDDDDYITEEPRLHMGDALHSQPTLLTYENGDDPYTTIFVGTNEGYLHAIEHKEGKELFSYIPKELLQNINVFWENQASDAHPYGLDGAITSWHDDTNDDAMINDGETAMIYFGMRRGGNSYYAIDVSDRLTPKLAWVIDPSNTDFSELGQSWSAMRKATIMHEGSEVDVLIFGAGYDVNQDKSLTTMGTRIPRSPDALGRGFYIVNAATGELIYSVSGSAGSDLFKSEMTYSIPSNIRILDTDMDGLADQLYASDLGGQIWRFDFEKFHAAASAEPLLKGGVMAKLGGTGLAGERRFYYEPDVAVVTDAGRRFISISVGSGWRAHPLDRQTNDRFYMIKSKSVYKAPKGYGKTVDSGETFTPIVDADLVDISNDMEASVNDFGWYLDFSQTGEKVLGASITADHKVFFTTYRPNAAPVNDSCSPAIGGGALYALDILNGAPAVDLNKNDEIDEDDRDIELITSGLPPPPSAIIHEEDLVISTGLTTIDPEIETLTSRTFWVDKGDGND